MVTFCPVSWIHTESLPMSSWLWKFMVYCKVLEVKLGKNLFVGFFFSWQTFIFWMLLLAAGKMAKQLPLNTTQLKIPTVRKSFLTSLLSPSALIPSCRSTFTGAFQGELPQYRSWAGEEYWPCVCPATLNKLRLVKGWGLIIILICKTEFEGAQQVVWKKAIHSSR